MIHGPPLQTPCDWPPASCGAQCPLQPILNNHLFYIVCQLWKALKLMYTVCNFSKEKSRSLGWLICSNALGQNSVLQRTLNFDYCLGLIKIYLLNPRQQDISLRNIARIANAVQVPICLLVSTSVYQCLLMSTNLILNRCHCSVTVVSL